MNEMEKIKNRKMRKATQHRVNANTGKLEEYEIEVPLELEGWEKDALEKQYEARRKRGRRKRIPDKRENIQTDVPDNQTND